MRRTTLSPTLRRSSVKNLSVPTTVLSIANSRPEHRANPCRLEYFRMRLQIFFTITLPHLASPCSAARGSAVPARLVAVTTQPGSVWRKVSGEVSPCRAEVRYEV